MRRYATKDMDAIVGAKNRADEIFTQLGDMNAHVSESLVQVSEIADQIDRSVGLAVQSLQFEDIVSQLLSHADVDLRSQDNTLTELGLQVRAFIDTARDREGNIREALMKLSDTLQVIRETTLAEKNKAVLQESMDAGDIELF